MGRSNSDRILEDWDVASGSARRPATSPRPSYARGIGAVAAAVVALAVFALAAGAVWFSRPQGFDGIGGGGTPTPTVAVTPSAAPTPSPMVSSPTASPPTASPNESLGPYYCGLPQIGSGTASGSSQAQPAAVRIGSHPGYDRIVFEYSSAVTPSWTIESVDPPFVHDPSGLPMSVAGSAYLKVRLEGVAQVYTGATDFSVSSPVLVELARQGDYEGIQTWIAGLAKTTCVRVFGLDSPTRLVIDLQQ